MFIRFPSIDVIVKGARRALLRFPFSIASGIVTAALGISLVNDSARTEFFGWDRARLVAISWMGIPLFFLLRIVAESMGLKRRSRDLGLPLLGLSLLALMWWGFRHADDTASWIRVVLWGLSIHAFIAFAPFTRRGSSHGFWQYNRLLLERAIETSIYVLVLNAGLALALFSVDSLFNIDIDKKVYAWLPNLLGFIFHPLIFFAGVPERFDDLDRERSYPRVIEIFAQYILVPLVSLYVVILLAYFGKIVITQTWPRGMVGYLMSVAGVAGILANLLLWPAGQGGDGKAWVPRFTRLFFAALVPLSLLLLAAAFRRVTDYGLTEPRYLLVVFGIWLFGLAVYFSMKANRSLKVIPISLGLLAGLCSFGPWGAFSVAMSSQIEKLRGELVSADRWADGHARKSSTAVPLRARKRMSGSLDFLWSRNELPRVASWFPDANPPQTDRRQLRLKPWNDRYEPRQMLATIGIKYATHYDTDEEESRRYKVVREDGLTVKGFDYVVHGSLYGALAPEAMQTVQKFDWMGAKFEVRANLNRFEILKEAKVVSTADLKPLIERLHAMDTTEGDPVLPASELSVDGKGAGLGFRVVFSSLILSPKSKPPEVIGGLFDILLRAR